MDQIIWNFITGSQITSQALQHLRAGDYQVDHQKNGIWIRRGTSTAIMFALLGIK